MVKNKKRLILVSVFVSLVLGAYLNFYNLRGRGIFYYDEGYYLLSAQFYSSIARNASAMYKELKAEKPLQEIYDEYVEGTFLSTPKPLHGIIVAIFGFSGGVKDYTGALASGLFGLFSVVFVFLLGRRLFNAETGAFAAAILATSKYFVLYCRSGLAEVSPTFFFLAALYVYSFSFKREKASRYLSMTGILLALSVACNYRWMLLMPILVLFELVRGTDLFFDSVFPSAATLRQSVFHRIWFVLKRIATIFTPFVLVIVIFQAPYWMLEIFRPLPSYVRSYFDMIFGSYQTQAAAMVSTFQPHFLFFEFIWLLFNPLVAVLLVAGLFFSFKKLDLNKLLVCSIFLMPFVLFSLLKRGDNPRALSSVLPFIALLAAIGANGLFMLVARGQLTKRTSLQSLFFSVLVLSIWFTGLVNTYPLLKLKSGYKEAVQFLQSAPGGSKHFSSMWPISAFYLGRSQSYYPFPYDRHEAVAAHRDGINYMLIHFEDHNYLDDFIRAKIKIHEPVVRIENGDMLDWALFAEENHSDKQRFQKIRQSEDNDHIQIFQTSILCR